MFPFTETYKIIQKSNDPYLSLFLAIATIIAIFVLIIGLIICFKK